MAFDQVVLQEGENILRIGKGIAAALSSLTRTEGTLDVVLGKGSSFKCADVADTAPEWLTVNGQAARFSSDGTLEFRGYSEEESVDVDTGTGGKLFAQKPEHLPLMFNGLISLLQKLTCVIKN